MVTFKFWSCLVLIALVESSRINSNSLDLYEELQNLDLDDIQLESNSSCIQDIELIFATIKNETFEEWALTMIDSSAKIPNGLLGGNFFHIGQFDECLSVVHPDGHFTGKHCIAKIDLNISIKKDRINKKLLGTLFYKEYSEKDSAVPLPPLQYGICLPSTCSENDMAQIFNSTKMSNVVINERNCATDDPIEFSKGSWAVLSIIIILVVLAVCSTAYELYQIHVIRNAKPRTILIAFSLYSNTLGLFEIRESSGEMACLHGLRTLSMLWVVLGHTFEIMIYYPIQNLLEANGIIADASYIIVTNGYFSVDSFFFLSGLLVAFVFFRNISKNGYYDAPVSYIHRYIRLTPSLLLILLINMTVIEEIGKGPQWGGAFEPMAESCRSTWWSIILYVQNYAQPESNCLSQTWYLSCDMQMFWIAPLILYPIYFWPKIGMGFWAFLTIGSTLLTFAMAFINDYKANMTVVTDLNELYYDYITTHTRIMPWLVGVGLGVAICHIKAHKTKINMSKLTVILGWVSSTALCLGILYGFTSFDTNHNPSTAESTIYLSFTRLGWGIGLTWIVFACIYGYGGWVNSFLSWGIFQPLGKLSYNVYLLHITVLFVRIALYRTNINFDNITVTFEYTGVVTLSYLLSIVLYLLLDAPFAIIDRQLLSKIKIFPYPLPKSKESKKKEENAETGEIHTSNENTEKVIN